jgi:hypothetical protein
LLDGTVEHFYSIALVILKARLLPDQQIKGSVGNNAD